MKNIIKEKARSILGYNETKKMHAVRNDEVEKMSKEQKNLRLEIENCKDQTKRQELKSRRKIILKNITKKIKEIKEKEIEEVLREVEKTKDSGKMFKAVKQLHRKKFENPFIHDENGKSITKKQEVYKIIESHFREHFCKEDTNLSRFVEEPRKLNKEITAKEVEDAVRKMSNNKAPGKDNIPVELLKYAPKIVYEEITKTLNSIFEDHESVDIGYGILIPLPKPLKTKGPVKNLRPITLLEVIRKFLSKIELQRIEKELNLYLSKSQSAYRKFRSTTDIIWAYRWILAKVQEQEIEVLITGIDMSSAFDTIKRDKILQIVEEILAEDEKRILRVLLSETKLEVKVHGAQSKPFISNIGAPQGDSLSGPIFTLYFEDSLRKLRKAVEESPIDVRDINPRWIEKKHSSLPKEMIYADDCDFLSEEEKEKENINSKISLILKENNLLINEEKTEHTILKRGESNTERWRKVKKLGTLLGDREDIARRKQMSYIAQKDLNKLWKKKKYVSLDKRLQLYDSLVKSILLYNCSTWGLTLQDEKKLDSFHRQQMRRIINIRWPHIIRNNKLYELTKTRPISIDITERRWKMFGHSLRMDPGTPARQAMKYFFEIRTNCKFSGRKRATIFTTINRDIKKTLLKYPNFAAKELKTEIDLHNIRVKANNRRKWTKMVKQVVEAAYSNISNK